MSGLELFQKAQLAILRSLDATLGLYAKFIRISKDEDPLQRLSLVAIGPPLSLYCPLRGPPSRFLRFHGDFSQSPSQILQSDQTQGGPGPCQRPPGYLKDTSRFVSERGQTLIKSLQIIACTTLGILALDAKGRPAAAKRYREALDIGSALPPSVSSDPAPSIECAGQQSLIQARKNLVLIENEARKLQSHSS